MPCGACAALLSVPAGLWRFACPLCGVELDVDGGRLRVHLASRPLLLSLSRSWRCPPTGVTLTTPSPHRQPEGQLYHHTIRSAHRGETFSSSRTDARAAIHNTLAQKGPNIHSVHREESHIESLNKTTANSSARKTRLQACPESADVETARPEPTIHARSSSQAQARLPSYSVCRDHTQGERPVERIASHGQHINEYPAASSTAQHETIERLNQDNHVEQVSNQNKMTGWSPKRKRSGKSAGGNQKGKKKSSPNERVHLRRSARLSKQPEHSISDEHVQQPAASSNQYNSDPPDIDKIIANLCPSPLPQHQMPQASSSQSGQVDAATGPSLLNHGTSQPAQLPLCYSPEIRGTHWLDSGEEQPYSPEARCHVMHVQQEDVEGGHSLLGSADKSSGKRMGRGRQSIRLIEPRREVDRPVLSPNIIDKWDSNPACTKVAATITALLKQKYPGSTYLPAHQQEVPPDKEVVFRWRQYPPETRAAILSEFLQRYKWAPGQEAECLKLFQRRAARQFVIILSETKRKARVDLAAAHKTKEAAGAHRSNGHHSQRMKIMTKNKRTSRH